MKNAKFKLLIMLSAAFMAVIFTTKPAKAQLGDIGAFLEAGVEDATLLTKEYLKPYPTGFGTALNTGFVETAGAKKLFGFSLQIRPSLAFVPGGAKSFDISTLGLQKITVAPGENPVTPTIAGASDDGPLLEVWEDFEIGGIPQSRKLTEFTMPGGTGFGFVPAPIFQAGLGLIKDTDITVRFLPEIALGDFGDVAILGGAIKHGINQYLPAEKLIPVDISVMLGFNRINLNANLDLQPDANASNEGTNPNPDFSNQRVATKTSTFVGNLLVGKSIPFISVYGGVGFQKATFDLTMEGDYPVNTVKESDPFGNYYTVITDPVSFDVKSDSKVHALAGFRLRFGVIALFGEATFANYFIANGGIGISFR